MSCNPEFESNCFKCKRLFQDRKVTASLLLLSDIFKTNVSCSFFPYSASVVFFLLLLSLLLLLLRLFFFCLIVIVAAPCALVFGFFLLLCLESRPNVYSFLLIKHLQSQILFNQFFFHQVEVKLLFMNLRRNGRHFIFFFSSQHCFPGLLSNS